MHSTQNKKVLPDIIHPDQTGFLHGRYIGDNIRQLLETIEHYETSKIPGLVFVADFEKAFDKVRLEFIYKCLDYFKLGESLIQRVKVIYSNPRCKIVNNGYFSESIELLKGLKQRCLLSPYLFVMAIEMLAITIRSNKNIKGLEIQGIKTKVSMYAVDSSFFLSL